MIYFETKRLIARDYLLDDYFPFAKLNTDPSVMKFFPNLLTSEESNALLDRNQQELALLGYGLFAIEEKTTGDFIGFTGFHEATFEADFTPCTEIGWRLKANVWNQGYATEAALGCIQFAHEHTSIVDIFSFTASLNIASEQVMKKIKLSKIANFDHPVLPENHPLKPHVLYKL
ncbi:GNAT family N-acetyltransferase [Listeria ivanovii]|uniref:GNAT family N-acetyltransferase n=2 Tax=Listeria ivanovii TaxID=1638 RepID=A0ABS1G4B2_LISIV|nr:GNAT family N-acetyltransferase [Listeria ivanovii]EFR97091.1 acetyltransferase [Listeria ivanovii FSL F6-596]AIS59697.1 GNAT family acetyltransferase [Listeria ivanovii subsp. londoniensis]AIS62531.1 GNAT family acetyltransferase [Listeria ivanovii subsp. londoniensis]MBC2254095.1 GNAT family N-acetyltransferase [Listeria ivanovii]MBK1961709.1 GNAT family N-acetyltransferase [Listeria ivanovii subsp. londoniensis]